jgi:hypothetical protein
MKLALPRFRVVTLALLLALGLQAHADPLAPTGTWSAYTAGRAATPPMGWSSWNAFGTDIDEHKVLGAAQALVDQGLAAKGYRYINIDDGWWLQRRLSDGTLIIRTERFPSTRQANGTPSFRSFTDRLHAMGLKAGIKAGAAVPVKLKFEKAGEVEVMFKAEGMMRPMAPEASKPAEDHSHHQH